jgi:hypothetical protein
MLVCDDTGKNCYATKKQARRIAKLCMKSRGKRLRVYLCPECKRWHLTKEAKPWR